MKKVEKYIKIEPQSTDFINKDLVPIKNDKEKIISRLRNQSYNTVFGMSI